MSIRYDSAARRRPAAEEFLEVVRYRDLLFLLISTGIKSRYKRSALGVVWTLLNPLLATAVLTAAFSTLFRGSLTNYPVYLLTGLAVWNFFSQSTTSAMRSLVWGGSVLKRIYVPRTIFSVSAIGNGLINLLLTLAPLAIIMLALRQPFTPALLFLPVSVLITAGFTLGVALLVSLLAVFFVDVVDMYGILLSAWFYLTPLIYPRSIMPPQLAWLLYVNPMHYLIELFRAPIYRGVLPDPATILVAAGWSLACLLVGWWAFTVKAEELAYRI